MCVGDVEWDDGRGGERVRVGVRRRARVVVGGVCGDVGVNGCWCGGDWEKL